MLHIVTPLYRYNLLHKVYESIPKGNDITWHIARSSRRDPGEFLDFIKSDKRIRYYELDCLDTDTTTKRNACFAQIKDGYFCFIDDDTEFHPGMYDAYRKCLESNFVGIMIGEQLSINGGTRLKAGPPAIARIDTGNALAHSSCLSECKWPEKTEIRCCWDYYFWKDVHDFYKNYETIDLVISVYNSLK
jgi:hypothetical protein